MKKLLENEDYFVRLVPFPFGVSGVNGMVTTNDDGTYSIYINANASKEEQYVAYLHELRHIQNNDFYNGKPIAEIEDLC